MRVAHLSAATGNTSAGRSSAGTATSCSVAYEWARTPALWQHGLVHEHVTQQQQQQHNRQPIVRPPHALGARGLSFQTGTAAGGNVGVRRLWPPPAGLSPVTPSQKAAHAVSPAVRLCHSAPPPKEEPTKPPAGAAASTPAGAAAAAAASAPHPVYNLPNLVSVARLVSGPVIGTWLYQGHFQVAMVALAVSGVSNQAAVGCRCGPAPAAVGLLELLHHVHGSQDVLSVRPGTP